MKLSLRAKATLLTSALVVATLAAVGVAAHREIESGRLGLLQQRQDTATTSIAAQVGAGLERRVARLETAAARIGATAIDDPARVRRALRDLSQAAAGFESVRYLPASADIADPAAARTAESRRSDTSTTITCLCTSTWVAAKPMPGAAYMVSAMSDTSFLRASSNTVTGEACLCSLASG